MTQHGFDAAGLQAYLKADPVGASFADNLTIIPEPAKPKPFKKPGPITLAAQW